MDSVIGATTISKNAFGIVGILLIVGMVVVPLIKSLVMLLVLNISYALAESFSDKRVAMCFEVICDSTKILIGVLVTNAMMYLMQMALLIKMKV